MKYNSIYVAEPETKKVSTGVYSECTYAHRDKDARTRIHEFILIYTLMNAYTHIANTHT